MKKKRGLLLILALILGGCSGNTGNERPEEVNDLLEKINKKRKWSYEKRLGLKSENKSQVWEEVFSEREISAAVDEGKRYYSTEEPAIDDRFIYDENREITKEQAIEDVEYLFKLLRNAYGLYEYFGGESVFNGIKKDIIRDIEKGELERSYDLSKILQKNTRFIKDAHFRVSFNNDYNGDPGKWIYTYQNRKEYIKDDKGYYYEEEGKKYYVISVEDNKQVEGYFKRTFGEYGEIKYTMAQLRSAEESVFNLKVKYECSGEESERREYFYRFQGDINKSGNRKQSFEYSLRSSIPYMRVSAMKPSSYGDESLKKFIKWGKKSKKYPVAILDLRDNDGGFDFYGDSWLKNYIGSDMDIKGESITIRSPFLKEVTEKVLDLNDENIEFGFEKKDGEMVPRAKNKRILFVIVNKNVMSSGELFIEDLTNIDNVVLVGSNTRGGLMGLGMNYFRLINSGIQVVFGEKMYMPIQGEEIELKGFEADFVIDPDEALHRTIRFIEKYKLNQ